MIAPGRPVGQELQRQRGAPDDLAPATLVARRGDPPQPVVDRLVEQLARVVLRVRPRLLALLEDERRALAVIEGEARADTRLRALERDGRRERQRQLGRGEDGAAVGDGDVRRSRARSRTAARPRRWKCSEPFTQRTRRIRRWRCVPCRRSSTGMKSTSSPTPSSDRKRVMSTFVSGTYSCFDVHWQRMGAIRKKPPRSASRIDAEHAGRVEAAGAVPVDRALGADERRGVQVADDAVLGDRQVVVTRGVGHAAILRLAWWPRSTAGSGRGRRRRPSARVRRVGRRCPRR